MCLASERETAGQDSPSRPPVNLSICTFSAAQLWLVDRYDAQVDSPEMLWIREASWSCCRWARLAYGGRNYAVCDAAGAGRS